MEDLKAEEIEFGLAREFLLELKKKFSKENEKSVKVAELKKIEQGERTIEVFIQEFRRTARGSKYKRRVLVKEFKREMSEVIKRKLMEIERLPTSIEQWYEYTTNLDRYWRESKRKEKRLIERKESRNQEQR